MLYLIDIIGKTTLLTKMAVGNRKVVSLDNPTVRALVKNELELFLQRYAPPVLIDEVQYDPEGKGRMMCHCLIIQ